MKCVCFCGVLNDRQCANILDNVSARINFPPTQFSMAVVVEMRSLWPFMQPSPKNLARFYYTDHGFLPVIRQDLEFDTLPFWI
jgi:hypothetical protein